ncbi:hypothetical protein M2148_003062, partial [Lachnospiraceae bacterium PF1-4]
CQAFFDKKWGILIKKESTSLVNRGLEIPRDYIKDPEDWDYAGISGKSCVWWNCYR